MTKNNITKYLKLPVQFDEMKLLADLNKIMENQWIPHFNKEGYSGNWNSIALLSGNGDSTNIYCIQ